MPLGGLPLILSYCGTVSGTSRVVAKKKKKLCDAKMNSMNIKLINISLLLLLLLGKEKFKF
jgi:hypothetical protein